MSSHQPHILVVDDNHSIVTLTEGVLRKQGFRVSTAFDGIEGLDKAVREKPDLIILDIEMPGMDGYEVCQRLQRHASTAKIPVLMLTVKGQLDTVAKPDKRTYETRLAERNKGFEVGAIEFISKPILAKALVAQVKRLLWIDTK